MKPVSARRGIVLQVWQTGSCDMGSVDPDRLAFVLLQCNFNSTHNTNAICLKRSPRTKEQTKAFTTVNCYSTQTRWKKNPSTG